MFVEVFARGLGYVLINTNCIKIIRKETHQNIDIRVGYFDFRDNTYSCEITEQVFLDIVNEGKGE